MCLLLLYVILDVGVEIEAGSNGQISEVLGHVPPIPRVRTSSLDICKYISGDCHFEA